MNWYSINEYKQLNIFFSDLRNFDWESESKRRKVDLYRELDLELWHSIEDETEWRLFESYVQDCRININVRQVLHVGESSL